MRRIKCCLHHVPHRLRPTALSAWLLVLIAGLVWSAPSTAAPITIINSGFEDITGESPSNEFTFGPLTGWDLYDPLSITGGGAGGTYFIGTLMPTAPDFFTDGASENQRVGIAFNFSGSGGQGEYGLQQTLTDTLQANTNYMLKVDVGNIASGISQSGQTFNLDGFPGYRVDLMAGGVLLTQDNSSLTGTIAEGTFRTSTVSFTTGVTHSQLGQNLQIRLVNLNQVDALHPNADLEVDFDNLRLDAVAVPEPSSSIICISALALLIRQRRKRHQ